MDHKESGALAIKRIKKKKKSAFESVQMRWMKLEPIIQSEVSQKEKHQYSILTYIYGCRKTVTMILYARKQKRDVKNKLLDYVESKGG